MQKLIDLYGALPDTTSCTEVYLASRQTQPRTNQQPARTINPTIDPAHSDPDRTPELPGHSDSTASKAKIKSGDMLICHGTNSSGKFLGHEAIATSGNYVLEMRGPEGAKNNNYHTPITTFFKNHLKKTGDYIQVYRIKSHPNYSSDAAKYAYNHMYISNKINYLTTTNLYHKNPSYCSKYVYLAYWWGTSHKGMKGGLMWVFPFSMTNVFSGTYKPSYIYKLTTK